MLASDDVVPSQKSYGVCGAAVVLERCQMCTSVNVPAQAPNRVAVGMSLPEMMKIKRKVMG
jgi:hypothetical protein